MKENCHTMTPYLAQGYQMRTNLILTGILLGLIGGFFIGQFGSDVLLRMLEDRISCLLYTSPSPRD